MVPGGMAKTIGESIPFLMWQLFLICVNVHSTILSIIHKNILKYQKHLGVFDDAVGGMDAAILMFCYTLLHGNCAPDRHKIEQKNANKIEGTLDKH